MPMWVEGVGQATRAVEALVEARVRAVGLVREYRAERAAVGGEASISSVDVLAVGDGGGYGLVGVARYARLDDRAVPPTRGSAPVPERTCALAVLVIHETQHGLFHVPVVRRTERLDEHLAVPLQANRGRHRQILTQRLHEPPRRRTGPDRAGEGDLLHAEAQGPKPDEGVRREVREPAEVQRLGHQRQVLQHLALFYSGELVEPGLQETHRGETAFSGFVVEVPTLGPRESRDARRLEAIALVYHEIAEFLAEGREQNVDVERRKLVDRQEVCGAGQVGRPLVEGHNEGQLPRHIRSAVGNTNA